MSKLVIAAVVGLSVVAGLPAVVHAQATAKPQSIWNQQEREAVEAVNAWVNAWATGDPQRVAALMADDAVFRSDPSQPMQTGRDTFIKVITPLLARYTRMTIDEVYVTGAEWDTNLMIKRSDTLSAAAGAGLAGRTVTVAAFFRVKNRRITEWLDAPVINPAANAPSRPADAPVTIKPPSSYNQQERAAVEVVRGWLNAWTAYDMKKLISYMAEDSIYRGDPSESLGRLPGFQTMAQGVMNGWCGMDLEEIFVIGGERDTMVLSKRIDYFPGDSGLDSLRGMAIPVAVMFRIRGGKIVEYLDAPLIPVGPGAWGGGGRLGGAPSGAPAGGPAGPGAGAPGGARGGPVGTCSAKIN